MKDCPLSSNGWLFRTVYKTCSRFERTRVRVNHLSSPSFAVPVTYFGSTLVALHQSCSRTTYHESFLNPTKLRQFKCYDRGSHNKLIVVTLKLYNVMSDFASGRDRKAVLEVFGWEIKFLLKLLHMRRKMQLGEYSELAHLPLAGNIMDVTSPMSPTTVLSTYERDGGFENLCL